MAPVLLSALSGCTLPAALDTQTPQGEAQSGLIWGFTALCSVIWLAVLIGLFAALWQRRALRLDPLQLDMRFERRTGTIVGALIALTGAIVIALTVLSFGAQRELFGGAQNALTIDITGHQWWWEIVYNSADPSKTLSTANEVHVPVGELVRLELKSADVIHSFWVPSLMGKEDLIPGRTNELTFMVKKPGVYNGTCAEFCGLQHAHMGIRVIAQTKADFDAWADAQRQSAAKPTGTSAEAGKTVFETSACALCHNISGTPAGGAVGPDLTHLASRTSLAAGELPFGKGQLAAWISDPQGIKPGSKMPDVRLSPDQLNSVVDYLMELK